MMLKTTILTLFVLVNLVFTRPPKEDVCEREERIWKACFDPYLNKTGQSIELTSTVSPGNQLPNNQHIKDLKDVLSCIGELHCKGLKKLIKFQLDTASFVFDKTLGELAQCAQVTRGDLPQCVFDHELVKNPEYNGEILTCTGNILEATECTEEEKRVIMGAARAQNDFMEIASKLKKNEIDANLFDETFDPTKYH